MSTTGTPLDTAGWAEADRLFDQALDLPADERTAFLDAACKDRPDLRARLDRLIADAESDTGGGLERPAWDRLTLSSALDTPEVRDGERVGPYRLEERVGEGGMGAVYRAVRVDGAFERTVALKVIRRSLALTSRDARARFIRERAVLASLNHEGIARLLDGGETADGVPYLAMEFVDGEPITQYAERKGLDVEARLHLFVDVCHAVQHAHQRLVVHRDLKPSNVLVADGTPDTGGRSRLQVKVLDFGVARLLGDAEDGAPITGSGIAPLTPGYAAPEQFDGRPVTTATDVYALGVLLYELLTGRRPEARAIAPERPSAAVTRPAPTAPPGEPARLSRLLRGDLDVICLKALAPEPERRYEGAAALADDVERHLDGLPIAARRDSAAYVARRFVARHRLAVGAAALVAVALVAALVVSLVALKQTRAAEAAAVAEAERARAATDFLSSFFDAADPTQAGRPDVTAREVLDAGRDRLDELDDNPALQAEVISNLAATYINLGETDDAEGLYRRGLDLVRRNPALRVPWAYLFQRSHALALMDLGRPADAVRPARLGLAGALAAGDTLAIPKARRALAEALGDIGQMDEAEQLLRTSIAEARARRDTVELARTLNVLGLALSNAGRERDAIPLLEETMQLRRQLYGEESAPMSVILTNLGNVYGVTGRHAEADRMLTRVLALDRRLYGPDHPDVALDLLNLGRLRLDHSRADEAVAPLRDALALQRRVLDPDHPDLADSARLLAAALAETGGCAEALPLAREAARALANQPGHNGFDAARARATEGQCLLQAGQRAEGEQLVRAAATQLADDPSSTPEEIAGLQALLTRGR